MQNPNRSLHLFFLFCFRYILKIHLYWVCTEFKWILFLFFCTSCLGLSRSFTTLEIILKWRIAWLIYSKSPRTQVNMRKIRVNFIISSHVRLFALALCRMSLQGRGERGEGKAGRNNNHCRLVPGTLMIRLSIYTCIYLYIYISGFGYGIGAGFTGMRHQQDTLHTMESMGCPVSWAIASIEDWRIDGISYKQFRFASDNISHGSHYHCVRKMIYQKVIRFFITHIPLV